MLNAKDAQDINDIICTLLMKSSKL